MQERSVSEVWRELEAKGKVPSLKEVTSSGEGIYTVKLPSKDMRKFAGTGYTISGKALLVRDEETGAETPVILISSRAPLSTRLHELAHVTEGHLRKDVETPRDFIQIELDAEAISNQYKGKKPISMGDLLRVALVVRDTYGLSLSQTVEEMARACEGLGLSKRYWKAFGILLGKSWDEWGK